MIRGWRLDPRWVEYYARRDAGRLQRIMNTLDFKRQQEILEIERNASAEFDRLRKSAWDKSTIKSDYAWQLRNEGK